MSDKILSYREIAFIDCSAAVVCFVAARWRWWLAIPVSIVPVAIFGVFYDMWSDVFFRQALLQEQGPQYLAFFIFGGIAVVIALASGTCRGLQRRANAE